MLKTEQTKAIDALEQLMKAIMPALQQSYPKSEWAEAWQNAEDVLRESGRGMASTTVE